MTDEYVYCWCGKMVLKLDGRLARHKDPADGNWCLTKTPKKAAGDPRGKYRR